jgi:hypothetical protein
LKASLKLLYESCAASWVGTARAKINSQPADWEAELGMAGTRWSINGVERPRVLSIVLDWRPRFHYFRSIACNNIGRLHSLECDGRAGDLPSLEGAYATRSPFPDFRVQAINPLDEPHFAWHCERLGLPFSFPTI